MNVIGLVLALLIPTGSQEISRSIVLEAESELFSGRKADVFYGVEDGGSWALISVFSQPFGQSLAFEPNAPRRWVARRQTGRGEQFSAETVWADSAWCPALEGVLWSLERLTVPSLSVSGITPTRPGEGVPPVNLRADGPVFMVSGRGLQPGGAIAEVNMRAIGGELDAWGQNAEAQLAECWRPQLPAE